jgi:hypothetical protein
MHVPDMGTGRCLDPEGNGAGLGEGGEVGPGPPERGKDRQLKPSDSKNARDRCVGKKEETLHNWLANRKPNYSCIWSKDIAGAAGHLPAGRAVCMYVKRAHEKRHEGVCSLSLWRVVRGSKLMHFDSLIHGSFIT